MAETRAERLRKQRDRQREYRARVKEGRRPTRADVARALLHSEITRKLKRGREEEMDQFLDDLIGVLIAQGFDKRATDEVIEGLLTKYARGWAFQRKLRLEGPTAPDEEDDQD